MKIALIGSGHIATFLGIELAKHEHIVQVISPNQMHAAKLAEQLNCAYSNKLADLTHEADVYILAVKDDVLIELAQQINRPNALVIHTAGAVDLQVLSPMSTQLGSIWCFYSIQKEHLPTRKDIPLILQANDAEGLKTIQYLANHVSTQTYVLNDEQKKWAHLAAVFANNFSNHLIDISQQMMNKHQMPFELIKPIIENTIEKLSYAKASDLQSGPAIRGDQQTIQKQLTMLQEKPLWQMIYQAISESIQHSRKNNYDL